jgi:hypothetical protein
MKQGSNVIYIPESTSIQFQIVVFGVVLDGRPGIAGRFLVVGLLRRISTLICISHLEPNSNQARLE